MLLAGEPSAQLGAPEGEIYANTGRHVQRGRRAAHTAHTGMDVTALSAHVGTLREGDAVIPNTHAQAHTDRCTWGYVDTHRPTHTPAAHPPSVRVGAAMQPIWCPDPAGLSQSLVVGWG